MTHDSDAKVVFRVTEDDGSVLVETLWATSLGDDRYKIDNSPFYAYGVSWEDVVYAPIDSDDGSPLFVRVLHKFGNRTVRVIFDPPVQEGNESDRTLQGLLTLGCSYEAVHRRYMSVNVPPEVSLGAVRDYLVEQQVQWEYADPTYEDLHPNED
jgi:Domain of unknown function (DUF4265)